MMSTLTFSLNDQYTHSNGSGMQKPSTLQRIASVVRWSLGKPKIDLQEHQLTKGTSHPADFTPQQPTPPRRSNAGEISIPNRTWREWLYDHKGFMLGYTSGFTLGTALFLGAALSTGIVAASGGTALPVIVLGAVGVGLASAGFFGGIGNFIDYITKRPQEVANRFNDEYILLNTISLVSIALGLQMFGIALTSPIIPPDQRVTLGYGSLRGALF